MSYRGRVERLYRAERGGLFTYALSITGDAGLAEDAVQDVFRRLCESPVRADNLRSYVYRSVRNRSLDVSQRRRPRLAGGLGARWTSIYQTDGDTVERDAQGIGVQAIGDFLARSQGGQDIFDRVGASIATAQDFGLIDVEAELAHLGLAP